MAEIINSVMCQENSPGKSLCETTMIYICGQNKESIELDARILPDFIKHIAHAASIKQFNHYFQLYTSAQFQQYDYQLKNRDVYNSTVPPKYDLKYVIAPVYLYSGGSDMLVSERDVEHLKEVLPSVRKYRSIRNFNHCDFNYGKNGRTILFYDILSEMNSERNV